MKLLVVQPWFSAIGHPAQSLISMASAIGKDERVEYLVADDRHSDFVAGAIEKLREKGKVWCYTVHSPVGNANTILALLALCRIWFRKPGYQRIFFMDESLFPLALLWPLVSPWVRVERLGILHLFAPELNGKNIFKNFIIRRFLNRREVRFYLRTEEMADAWRDYFHSANGKHIKHLPSLEIPDEEFKNVSQNNSEELAFGIIGQIRIGKGIEWLVPMFEKHGDIGKLMVAGEFNTPETRAQLSVLNGFEGFINCFMSEEEMMRRAAEQDYLLMLYDKWDRRMESAILYLAARVNRPVIVYGDSWCGRMVKEFECGIVVPTGEQEIIDLLRKLPRPGSVEYANLLKGMSAFREAYSVKSLRGIVIQELLE